VNLPERNKPAAAMGDRKKSVQKKALSIAQGKVQAMSHNLNAQNNRKQFD